MAWVAVVLCGVIAGDVQCETDMASCPSGVGDGRFWYSRLVLRYATRPYPAVLTDDRHRLCSLDSWATSDQCHERCNFRLEITQPADLRMVVCLVDNDYPPYAPDAHIDLHHPLNGVEHDIVNVSANVSSCLPSGGVDVAGKIALQGSTCYDPSVARAARAGGAVMSIKTSWSKDNRVDRTFPSWGTGWGLEDFPSAVMPRHHSLLLWEALERGAAVRGKVVFRCDELPQISGASAADLGDGCPSPRMAGMCHDRPLLRDRLCSRCPLELRIAGVTACLWGNTLLPRKRETLLQNTVQLPLEMPDGLFVVSDLPDGGCSASDYAQLSGKIVVVQESRSCLPFTQVRLAQAQGVRAVVVAPYHHGDDNTLVEGPSLGVTIPVHAITYPHYTALKAAAEQRRVVADVGSMPGAGLLAVGGDIPALPPARDAATRAVTVVPGDADPESAWEWNTLEVACVVLCVVEVGIIFCFVLRQRENAIELATENRRTSIPLGIASTGLSLSLLVITATVAFALANMAGRESRETALKDGREATLTTHDNAANNIAALAVLVRALITEHALDSVLSMFAQFASRASIHRITAGDFDGTWHSFVGMYPRYQELARAEAGTLKVQILTTNGFFADLNLLNDHRTEAERGDGVSGDVASNNTGFPYGLMHSYSAYPPPVWDVEYFPAPLLNYSYALGSSWRNPLALFNSSSSPSTRVWHVARRAVDVRPIVDSHSIVMATPFFNKNGQYWGTLQATDLLSVVGVLVKKAVRGGSGMQKMTALIVDYTDGAIIANSAGDNVREEAVFPFINPKWYVSDVKLVQHLYTMQTIPAVHINALGAYLDKQQDGWVEHNGEFDQAEGSHQCPYFAKLRVAGGAAVDESGEDVKAESRGGGCGSCTVMDDDLGREVFVFDGNNVLHIYNNLTVGAPAVAKTRTSPVGQAWASNEPEYAESIVMSDGTECVARRPPGGGALGCFVRPAFTYVRYYTISMRVRPDDVAVNRQVRGAQLFSQTLSGETNVRVFADGEVSVNVMRRGCRVKGVPGGLPVGRWSTVTLVFAEATLSCSVYIDGMLWGQSYYMPTFFIHREQTYPYYAGQHFHGRMDNIMLFRETLTAAEVMSLHTAGEIVRDVPSRTWFVATKAITMDRQDDHRGASWSVAVVVPREEIMRQVDENNRVTMSNLAMREDITNKKLERKTNETVLVIVVISLFSVGVFLVFNSMLTRPFARYAVLMTEAAVMKVDELPQQESFIRELCAMDSAMHLMISSLKEYKSYMPQSLHFAGLQPSDAEGSEQSTPSGSIQSQSSSSSAGRAVIRQVLMCALSRRRFSFVVVNVTNWHDTAMHIPDTALLTVHADVLHRVLSVFNSNRGISEVFSGDRFSCTFNAAKNNTCHCASAASSAFQATGVIEKLAGESEHCAGIGASASAVSGNGRVGNMGNNLMKRFTCVSPVLTWGFALERFCRSRGLRVLADAAVCQDATYHFQMMLADAVIFPKQHPSPINVALIVGTKTGCVGEWMYQIDEASKSDPFHKWNKWARQVFQGTYENEHFEEFGNNPLVSAQTGVFTRLCDAAKLCAFTPSCIDFH